VYRVYVNGQIITRVPGGVDTLEGKQVLFDDQTAQGADTATNGPPPQGGGTQAQPQWAIATPVAYPYLNNWGTPAPQAQPYSPGQRPRYYLRGGNIGFVPAPAVANSTVVVEGVFVPPTLTTTYQTIQVPDIFADAIDFYVISRCWGSDKDEVSQNMAAGAMKSYDGEIRKLRTWKRQYSAEDDALLPLNYRAFYWFGQNRNGGAGWNGY
jgi:hypothetical protein